LSALVRQKKRVGLVENEIHELPEGTNTFQSIGAFALQGLG
jgi:hypothetical protein